MNSVIFMDVHLSSELRRVRQARRAERALDLDIEKGFVDEDLYGPMDLRGGRGWVALGALVLLIGFLTPLVEVKSHQETLVYSAMKLATVRAQNLWNIPMVFVAIVYLWMTRVSRFAMMRLWLAFVILGWVPLLSSLYSLWRVFQGVKAAPAVLSFQVERGVLFLALGAVLITWGAIGMARQTSFQV